MTVQTPNWDVLPNFTNSGSNANHLLDVFDAMYNDLLALKEQYDQCDHAGEKLMLGGMVTYLDGFIMTAKEGGIIHPWSAANEWISQLPLEPVSEVDKMVVKQRRNIL